MPFTNRHSRHLVHKEKVLQFSYVHFQTLFAAPRLFSFAAGGWKMRNKNWIPFHQIKPWLIMRLKSILAQILCLEKKLCFCLQLEAFNCKAWILFYLSCTLQFFRQLFMTFPHFFLDSKQFFQTNRHARFCHTPYFWTSEGSTMEMFWRLDIEMHQLYMKAQNRLKPFQRRQEENRKSIKGKRQTKHTSSGKKKKSFFPVYRL